MHQVVPLPPRPKVIFSYCQVDKTQVCLSEEDAKKLSEYILALERAAK